MAKTAKKPVIKDVVEEKIADNVDPLDAFMSDIQKDATEQE